MTKIRIFQFNIVSRISAKIGIQFFYFVLFFFFNYENNRKNFCNAISVNI